MRPFFFLALLSFVAAVPAPWAGLNLMDTEQRSLSTLSYQTKTTILKDFFPHDKNYSQKTIWELLSNDSDFTKLTKAIEFADAVHDFDDTNADYTFFATPDWALSRPHHGCDGVYLLNDINPTEASIFAVTQKCHWDDVMVTAQEVENSFEDGRRRRLKRILKHLVRAILAYQTLSGRYSIYSLGRNTTHATKLVIPGILEGQPLRLAVEQTLLPPSTNINYYSQVIYPDVKASNGIIHVVNHPILPPLSAFQTLFMLPHYFSHLTSAIQHVGLTDKVDLRFRCSYQSSDKNNSCNRLELEGTSSLTLFAPMNSAFDHLPQKLRFFLFSPFGNLVLRKLLEYHIVPGLVIHSDYQYNKSASTIMNMQLLTPGYSSGEKLVDEHLMLPTLLHNHNVHTHIERTQFTLPVLGPRKPTLIKTAVAVNQQEVFVRDVVASNAAIHTIDHLLDPRCYRNDDSDEHTQDKHEGHQSSWEDWEEWLLEWAEST